VGPAINRCMQLPDRTARRGQATFAGWCPSAARCCSLRSKLRSPGGRPASCVMVEARAHLTPRSTPPSSPASDLRCDLTPRCACGARVSAALSSPLSSARRRGSALFPSFSPSREFSRCGGEVSDDLHAGTRVAFPWRCQPRDIPGRLLDGTGTCVIGAVPGMSCRSPRGRLAGCHTCPSWAKAEVLVHSSVRIWGCTYHPHGVTSLCRVPRAAAQ
jgi:hypothetical protein